MKHLTVRILSATLALLLLFSIPAFADSAASKTVTILFTHDLHSHFLPATDDDGSSYGGYARLMTLIHEQQAIDPDAILVDAGDFSMGSLFQTAYATSALELRMMGRMGFDATTFGNHEYDYLPAGLASMLNAAAASGDPLPALVEGNYFPPTEDAAEYDAEDAAVWEAFENYGVKEYILLERGGTYYVIFGITGYNSDLCAPASGMILEDPVKAAQRIVDKATAECLETYGADPIVICLSHSGTENGQGEDYDLAKNVTGIDVIVSGHTHTLLPEPLEVNGTFITSAQEYGKYLGVLRLNVAPQGNVTLADYELIPVNDTVSDDPEIAALTEEYKASVETSYLNDYGMSFDQVLINNPYTFDTVDQVYATQHESTLGNLYSDAYKWAVEKATGQTVDIAVTAAGVIRESIPTGSVTVSDVFNAASLGVGTEGELIAVYVTGEDLLTVLEIDASVQPLMANTQLFASGAEYSFNTNRMLFNKVDYAMLRRGDGTLEAIQKDKLYRVVTGMYCGQMLASVKETSFGLINISPRNAAGEPIVLEDLHDYVVRSEDGTPLKEWYAISSYLENMGGEMDASYAQPDGRKNVYSSWNPVRLFSGANRFTFVLLGVILFLLIVIALIVFVIVRKVRRRKH